MGWWPFTWRGSGQSRGVRGERAAARYLKSHGFRILARNYSCPAGEVDLVALDGATLVFVEVKTRADESFASAESAVNRAKRAHLCRAAQYYIRHKRAHDRPARFDVIAVVMPDNVAVELRHTPNAFSFIY